MIGGLRYCRLLDSQRVAIPPAPIFPPLGRSIAHRIPVLQFVILAKAHGYKGSDGRCRLPFKFGWHSHM